jgi:hypothetical protein
MLPLTVKLRAIDQAHSTVSWSAEDELGSSPPPEIIVPGRSARSPRSSRRIDRGGFGVTSQALDSKGGGEGEARIDVDVEDDDGQGRQELNLNVAGVRLSARTSVAR